MITTEQVKNPGFDDMPKTLFAPVLDGKKLNYCAEHEDVALLLALGHKYDGRNSQFAKMACRMLGLETKWCE